MYFQKQIFPQQQKMFSQAKKKGLKREDFQFENGWYQSLIKLPGQLHKQQFQISYCQQCNIFLFDSSATVYIDECKYCYIFIGPCQSSVFVRDCEYVTVIAVTKQFRVRDSVNCKVALWCESQPIIQSSYGLEIGGFEGLGYGQMLQQMKEMELNMWNNNWFDLYDFTPHKFNMENYKIVNHRKQLYKSYEQELIKQDLHPTPHLIPVCSGFKEPKQSFIIFIVQPVPKIWTHNLPFLHSRSIIYPQTLSFSQTQHLKNKMCLFLKVEPQNKKLWQKNLESSTFYIIRNDSQIEQIENDIFIPFKDQH